MGKLVTEITINGNGIFFYVSYNFVIWNVKMFLGLYRVVDLKLFRPTILWNLLIFNTKKKTEEFFF